MIDFALILIVGLITWVVASEGAWGALFIFFSVLFSGMIAMNFFEPVAVILQDMLGSSWRNRVDFIALVGLFIISVVVFRLINERIMPNTMQVHPIMYDGMRWLLAGMTGYVTMAFLLTAMHTAPLPRNFIGFEPERENLFGMAAPDRQWLGFTQYLTEKSFRNGTRGPMFDGASFDLVDGTKVYLSSFPIRYATRRGIGGRSAVSERIPLNGGGQKTRRRRKVGF